MPDIETEVAIGDYLYCIICCDEPREFSSPGLCEGGGLVRTVNYSNLAAVVSGSPVIEYDRSRRYLLAHTLVLEEVMAQYTTLPVRFGTVATGDAAIQEQVLSRRYDELTGLVAEMDGLVELGLKAYWQENLIFQEIVAESPASMRQLREKIAGKPPEMTYFERMKLGELVQAAMDHKRETDAAHLLGALLPLAEEHKLNPLFMDRMVLNGAFLVRRDRQDDFDAAMQQIDAEMGERLQFKYVGPVPCYNFVNLVINWDKD